MEDDGFKTVVIILMLVVLALVVVNPGGTIVYENTNVEYDVSDMIPVIVQDREACLMDISDDYMVYQDYSTGNWNIGGYDIGNETIAILSNEITDEINVHTHGNQTVWSYWDEEYYIAGIDRDNLTKWSYGVGEESVRCLDVWDSKVYYVISSDGELHEYDIYSDNDETLNSIWTTAYSIDVYGDDAIIPIKIGEKYCYCYYNLSTEIGVILSSQDSFVYSSQIYENLMAYVYYSSVRQGVEVYNSDTGRTERISEYTALGYAFSMRVAMGDNWVAWNDYNDTSGSRWRLMAHNLESDETITLVDWNEYYLGVKGIMIYDNSVYFTVQGAGGSGEYGDIYRVDIVSDAVVSPKTDEENQSYGQQSSEFITNNYVAISVIIIIVVGLIALEGAHYKWKHIKDLTNNTRGRITLLLISTIAVILILWYLLVGV